MADDVDSHLQFWDFPATATVDDLLVAISRQLLPSVAGPAGWCIYRDLRDLSRRRVLGLIYTRDDLKEEDRICRYVGGGETLARLARNSELVIDAVYLSGGAARAVTLSEMMANKSFTGAQPILLGSSAREYALIDWRVANEDRRLAAAVRDTRHAWVREHLLFAARPPADVDFFIAENFHFLTTLLCPASMSVAAELLGIGDELSSGTVALQRTGNPATAVWAMALGAFEWGIDKEETWRFSAREYCSVYLEFLARCGYQLTPIENVIAGHAASEQLTPQQARIRELRNAEYHLGRNHEHGLMTHDQYRALLASVAAELRQLGERPEPPKMCCQ
ncbi:hypothetical protein [Mycobacterium sp. MFM001]|uniref:hypothetical protein n=1 Tax=Mycobacterium sp. MFM001 TaxID=2049453 RepID=UPI000E2FD6EC|nr:hypothetical protein [Mycobacterium sp. MFM001]